MSDDGTRVATGSITMGRRVLTLERDQGTATRDFIFSMIPIRTVWVQLGQGIDGESFEDSSGASASISGDAHELRLLHPTIMEMAQHVRL
jgi:hypothetical protein